ncbi:hypothetical protein E2P81_ATG08376 [Venturia nashicola]|nr:hypothetical protein E2P81_ATG08376 [Venturia nashicola]
MGSLSSPSLALVFLLSSLASAQSGSPTHKEPASTTLSCHRFRKTGFWDIDIDNWPALAPECGPPLSIHSLRDRSKLPVQICAIVAAYLLFVVVVGILLVTVGKRSRNRAQGFVKKLPKYDIEMVKREYPHKNFEPLSPAYSQKSWLRAPFKGLRSSALSKASSFAGSPIEAPSPTVASINSFDNKTDAQNRESRQAELERLYAAVMAHEDAKRSTGQLSLAPSDQATDSIAPSPRTLSVPQISLQQSPRDSRRNLRVQITPAEPQHFEQQPKSPYRAIYPPSPDGQSMQDASPMTPMTPRRAGNYIPPRQADMWPLPSPTTPGPGPMSAALRVELPNDMYPASPAPRPVQMQLPPPPPPRPAEERQSSSSGGGRSRKLGLKNLRIRAPLRKDESDDRQPLTPRTFPPAAPPAPPAYGVRFQEPQLSGKSMDSYNSEQMDELQPLPMPTAEPQRQRRPSNLTLTLPPGPNSTKPASSSSVNSLPLRAFQNASAENINPASPGVIKTTYLEKKLEKVGRGPQTGRTPRTGVPPTPYSAYMPFTPITPVTPGLVSRKERKERIKAEGRKVLLEEDEVKDDEDMWDAGY